MSKFVCVVFHAIVLKRKENTDVLLSKSFTNDPFSCNVWY